MGKKLYPPETRIILPVVNPDLEQWMDGVFPEGSIDVISADYRLWVDAEESFDYENGSLSDFLEYSEMPITDHLISP